LKRRSKRSRRKIAEDLVKSGKTTRRTSAQWRVQRSPRQYDCPHLIVFAAVYKVTLTLKMGGETGMPISWQRNYSDM
jgi:hypothetical protein